MDKPQEMNRKDRKAVILCAGVVLLLAALWGLRRCDSPGVGASSQTSKVETQDRARTSTGAGHPRTMNGLYDSRIDFFRVVLDGAGTPVPDALIRYRAHDYPASGGDRREIRSDSRGMFSILGERGISLYVAVSKPGFRAYDSEDLRSLSARSFGYGVNLGRGLHAPKPEAPEVFRLRRIEASEALIISKERDTRIPADG